MHHTRYCDVFLLDKCHHYWRLLTFPSVLFLLLREGVVSLRQLLHISDYHDWLRYAAHMLHPSEVILKQFFLTDF